MEANRKDKNRSYTILIVEDSPTQAFKLKQILEAEGFKAAVSHNGKEALLYLKEKRPTVIISDVVMPEMDGYTLCQHIKSDKDLEAIPIILLTGLSDAKDVIKGLQCGADNFITKPYDDKFLVSRIQYVLLNEELRKKGISEVGLNIYFAGERYQINSNRMQIIDLLLSTYEHAVLQNQELKKTQAELRKLNEKLEEKVRQRTQKVEHLNSVILAVRNVNHLISREKDRDRLLKGACNSLIESRGYYNAWIILLEENGGFVTTAEAGLGKEFLPMLERLKRGELAGCVLQAQSQSEVVVIEDPTSTCADCPLTPSYAGRGDLAVRLEHAEKIYGVLVLSIPGSFTIVDMEQELLKEVAEDLGFALYSIELEENRKRGEDSLRAMTHQLGERVKELTCLYNMAGLMEEKDITLDEILQDTVNFIPAAFQHPEIACARVILEGKDFRTENFRKTTFKLTQDIKAYGKSIGTLEVSYLEQRPGKDESLFQKEESAMLAIVAERLGHVVERKLAEEALVESEERFKDLFQYAPDAYYLHDLEGIFMDGNTAAEELTGYKKDELIGKSFLEMELLSSDEIQKAASLLQKNARGLSTGPEEFILNRKDGKQVLIEIRTFPLNFRGDDMVLGIARDISERKSLEEQLRQSQKMEAIGGLAGGIAHDFNNLLTTIIGNVEIGLMDLGKEEPLHEILEEIKEAGERAASLTRQLLAFSRKQILQPTVMNLNDTIRGIEKMLRRIIGEDIELKTTLELDLGQVKVDTAQMEQVIMNLAVNARDAMPEGGKLTMETANVELDEGYARAHVAVIPGPYIMLAVSDTGIGMTKDVQARVFEPFFTTKEKGKGTGFGLSTAYGIVKQSGGNIWVYSEPEKGASFKIYLPRVEEATIGQKETKGKKDVPSGSERVLLVEDDESVRSMALKILEKYGYTVLCAADGREALRVCLEHEGAIDLILTDVIMPGMSGRDLAEQVQGLQPGLKVLFMSGYADNAIVHHGVLEKGIAFLQKPFSPEALARKVREVLGG